MDRIFQHGGDGVGLFYRLLGLVLGDRGAEHTGLVVFEALDFGWHVLEAGLFGGPGRFLGFWCLDGCLFGHLGIGVRDRCQKGIGVKGIGVKGSVSKTLLP